MNFSMKSVGILAALAAVAVAVAAAQDTFNLRMAPKKGDANKYKTVGSFSVQGFDVKATYEFTDTVKEVNEDGTYEVETVTGELVIDLGGQQMNQPAPEAMRTVYSKDGSGKPKTVPAEADPKNMARLQTLNTTFRPENPVKVGDTWEKEWKANKDTGVEAAKATYKLVAVEDVQGKKALKIEFEIKETEANPAASSKGTVWLDAATGVMLRQNSEWKDVPFPGSPEPLSGKVTIEKVG